MEPENIESAATDDARAAMQAGFNSSLGIEAEKEESVVVEEAPAAEPEKVEAVPETRVAGFTEAELKQRLDKIEQLEAKIIKTHDSVFGRVGDVQQAIKDLQAAQKTGRAVTAEQFAKLNSEVGSDVVNAIVEGLNAGHVMPAEASNQPSFDPVAFEQKIRADLKAERDAETRQRDERAFLKDHPDFREFKVSPEFKAYLASKTPEEQRVITSSVARSSFWRSVRTQSGSQS